MNFMKFTIYGGTRPGKIRIIFAPLLRKLLMDEIIDTWRWNSFLIMGKIGIDEIV